MRRVLGPILGILLSAACSLGSTPGSWEPAGRIAGIQTLLRTVAEPDGSALVIGLDPDRHLAVAVSDSGGRRWSEPSSGPDPKALSGFSIAAIRGGDVMVGLNQTWWRYRPAARAWTTPAPMPIAQPGYVSAALLDGRLLACGGRNTDQSLTTCQAYDPAADAWRRVADLHIARTFPSAITFPDGRVLVTGGFDQVSGDNIQTTEIYDPALDSWVPGETFARIVSSPQLIQLKNQRLLALGGLLGFGPGPTAQVMDERSGHWTIAAEAAQTGFAVEVPDGRVLALPRLAQVPGVRPAFYDPGKNEWGPATEPPEHLAPTQVARLARGQVLVVGGPAAGVIPTAIFDPAGYPGLPGSTGPLSAPALTPQLAAVAVLLLILLGVLRLLPGRRSAA